MREQVEACRLACAVRADQRVDRPARHRQVDAVDGDEPLEFLGEPSRFEDGVGGHELLFLETRSARNGWPPDRSGADYPDGRRPWQSISAGRHRYQPVRHLAARFSRNASMPSNASWSTRFHAIASV